MKVLGIAGSLRQQSYNRALLRAATQLCPQGVTIETFDLEGIPPFNQDHDTNPPERVKLLKSRIRAADAILLVTPEYNYSVPGVLKNAIDWASRPHGDSAWDDKPVAVMGEHRSHGHGARSIPLAADVRISQHACRERTRGDGSQRGAEIRRAGKSRR